MFSWCIFSMHFPLLFLLIQYKLLAYDNITVGCWILDCDWLAWYLIRLWIVSCYPHTVTVRCNNMNHWTSRTVTVSVKRGRNGTVCYCQSICRPRREIVTHYRVKPRYCLSFQPSVCCVIRYFNTSSVRDIEQVVYGIQLMLNELTMSSGRHLQDLLFSCMFINIHILFI